MKKTIKRGAGQQTVGFLSGIYGWAKGLGFGLQGVQREERGLTAWMEALEGRQMLLGAPPEAPLEVPSEAGVEASLVFLEEFVISRATPAVHRIFVDTQGNRVVFAVTGNGLAKLTIDPMKNAVVSVQMTGTDVRSGLIAVVTAGKEAEKASIREVRVQGDIGSISMPGLDLKGDFVATGAVGSVQFGDVGSDEQQVFEMGGTITTRTNVTLGRVRDVTLKTTGALGAFRVASWRDTMGEMDELRAPAALSIQTTGIARTARNAAEAGDFEASIWLNGDGISRKNEKTLGRLSIAGAFSGDGVSGRGDVWVFGGTGSVSISGAVSDALFLFEDSEVNTGKLDAFSAKAVTHTQLQAAGSVGPVTIGAADELEVDIQGNLGRFTSRGSVTGGTTVTVRGTLGAVTAKDWIGGSITGERIASITTTGRGAGRGNFSAYVEATGASMATGRYRADAVTVGAVTISGVLGGEMVGAEMGGRSVPMMEYGAKIRAQGGLGPVTAAGMMNVLLEATANITSILNRGQAQSVEVYAGGKLGAVASYNWLDGEISARQMTSITTVGFQRVGVAAVPGDLTGSIRVRGEDVPVSQVALQLVNVAGSLGLTGGSGAAIDVSGKIGQVRSGAVNGAQITNTLGMTAMTVKNRVDSMQLTIGDPMMEPVPFDPGIGSLVFGAISNSQIDTTRIGTLDVRGAAGLTGDMTNTKIHIENATANASAVLMSRMTVVGPTQEVQVYSSGSVGTITVGSFENAQLMIGFQGGGVPTTISDFGLGKALIRSFVVTGQGVPAGVASFAGSWVVAKGIDVVKLKEALSTEEIPGGFATRRIGTYVQTVNQKQTTYLNVTYGLVNNITGLLKSLIP